MANKIISIIFQTSVNVFVNVPPDSGLWRQPAWCSNWAADPPSLSVEDINSGGNVLKNEHFLCFQGNATGLEIFLRSYLLHFTPLHLSLLQMQTGVTYMYVKLESVTELKIKGILDFRQMWWGHKRKKQKWQCYNGYSLYISQWPPFELNDWIGLKHNP